MNEDLVLFYILSDMQKKEFDRALRKFFKEYNLFVLVGKGQKIEPDFYKTVEYHLSRYKVESENDKDNTKMFFEYSRENCLLKLFLISTNKDNFQYFKEKIEKIINYTEISLEESDEIVKFVTENKEIPEEIFEKFNVHFECQRENRRLLFCGNRGDVAKAQDYLAQLFRKVKNHCVFTFTSNLVYRIFRDKMMGSAE